MLIRKRQQIFSFRSLSSDSQLERFPIVNIDHHASGRFWGQVNWIDHGAASVGELVLRLVKAAGVKITPEMATCLYTTLLTDTGGFLFGTLRASYFLSLGLDVVW